VSDALFEATDLATVAQATGLEVLTAKDFTRSGGEPFGSNQAAIDAVFDPRVLRDAGISDIIEIDANRSVVLRVTRHQEATRQSLAEVRDQIVESVRGEKARSLVQGRVESLQASLRDGVAFADAAAAVEAVASPYLVINRLNEELDERVLEAIYRTKKPQAGKPRTGSAVTAEGDYAVFSIDAVAPGRPENVPLAERDQRKETLSGQSGIADYTAFILQLESEADIVRSEDALAEQDGFQ
jgi:peptidyl-prolyl cis-trans isomerase D